jgi:Secretion system C-terminal sorting domain/FG-GAP-like repeat
MFNPKPNQVMKKTISLSFALLFIYNGILFSQNLLDQPECASYYPGNQKYYISCCGNGKIVEIDKTGEQKLFETVGECALGSTISNGIIYVSLLNSIAAYNLETKERIFILDLPESSQLDAMDTDNNGNLYVTDHDNFGDDHRIFKIDLATNCYTIFNSELIGEGLQDIIYDHFNDRLIVAYFIEHSPIHAINPHNGAVTTLIESSVNGFNGIAMDNYGDFYFSSWNTTSIHKYDADFSDDPITISTGYDSPANLCFNPDKNQLVLPVFGENRIDIIQLMNFTETSVTEDFSGPAGIATYDMNNDGNMDFICAGDDLGVWYNGGDEPITWTFESIDNNFGRTFYLDAGDLNNDGFIDVVAGSWDEGGLAWWENGGSDPNTWTKHNIDLETDNFHEVVLFDLDKDNDLDIIGAIADVDEISWWENNGIENMSWTKHIVSNNFAGARSVYPADFDADGDYDLVGAALLSNEVKWWRCEDISANEWTEILIADNFNLSHRIECVDMDYDGDLDILGTAFTGGLKWWRNNSAETIIWTEHNIDLNFAGAVIANAVDIDADGDMDIIASSQGQSKISLWQNNGEKEITWIQHKVDLLGGVWPIDLVDIDNDSDIDIIAGGYNSDKIKLYQNSLFDNSDNKLTANFFSDFKTACINTEVTFFDNSVGDIDSYEWNFGPYAEPQTATGKGPHVIKFITNGSKMVSSTVTGVLGSDSKVKYYNVSENIPITVAPSDIEFCQGESVAFVASGAESYSWSPESGLSQTNTQAVIASPTETTTYTVLGSLGTCTGTTDVVVKVINNENDDMCNALSLSIGENGPFKNTCGSVEADEPVPPLTGCETQNSWCDEGGVQNSLWFKFEAPNSGNVSIASPGFDNQIALYKAASCEELSSGNYELLGANDDYDTNDFSAMLTGISGLNPGEIYWLQVDGSANGSFGEFNIIITELVSINEDDKGNTFHMYPNPANDIVFLNMKNHTNCNIQFINSIGKICLEKELPLEQNSVEISSLQKGLYIIRINKNNGGIIYTEKFIKK